MCARSQGGTADLGLPRKNVAGWAVRGSSVDTGWPLRKDGTALWACQWHRRRLVERKWRQVRKVGPDGLSALYFRNSHIFALMRHR
jgi:hypothetical protein